MLLCVFYYNIKKIFISISEAGPVMYCITFLYYGTQLILRTFELTAFIFG